MKWLERAVIVGPYLTYVDSEEEFKEVLAHLKYDKSVPEWCGLHARTHHFEKPGEAEDTVCVVCVTPQIYDREICEAVGLIVHEAVHVWQTLHEEINEHKPSHEFEAYSIQIISQNLIWEYLRRKEERSAGPA